VTPEDSEAKFAQLMRGMTNCVKDDLCLASAGFAARDAEDAHVQAVASGQDTAHFFADERAGQGRNLEGAGDGVVVGERDEVHAPPPGHAVNRPRLRVGLLGDKAEWPRLGGPGVPRVEVQIAAHYRGPVIVEDGAFCSSEGSCMGELQPAGITKT